MTRPYFSAVVPIFNEEGNIPELYRRLTATFASLGRSYEIVTVDDGSADRSFELLRELHQRDPHVRVVKFSRNFGHHMAITAGMDAARGEAVILMDADLQDQPEEIATLHAKFEEGFDVVYGIRREKKFSWFKRVTSTLFMKMLNRAISGSPSISPGIFRIIRRNVVDVVVSCREVARFVGGLISWSGFKQVGVPVEHGTRHSGETKYTLKKMIKLALAGLTSFSSAPLHVASFFGLLFLGLGALTGLVLLICAIGWGTGFSGWSLLAMILFVVSGVQLVCLGIAGEYIGRIFAESQKRPLYIVEQHLGADPPDGE